MDRRTLLEKAPVAQALWHLSLPAITGMLVLSSYNIVDAVVVGWGTGPMGMAAIAIGIPIQFFMEAVAMWSAIGTASLVARSLGAGETRKAEAALMNGIFISLLMGLICLAAAELLMEPILSIAGATQKTIAMSREYMAIIFLGFPFLTAGNCVCNAIRAEGNTKYAMFFQIYAGLVNVVLDPLFMFPFGWGVKGVAWATVIGQSVLLFCGLGYYLRGRKNTVRLVPSLWRPNWPILWEVLSVGLSEFLRLATNSAAIALLLNLAVKYGNELYVAAYGITVRLMSLAMKPALGLGQGLLPLVGYNYGAHDYLRAWKAIKTGLLWGSIWTTSVSLVLVIFPQVGARLFTNDPPLIDTASVTTRIVLSFFGVVGFHVAGTVTFQALGMAKEAIFLSMCRKLIFLLPLMYLLPPLFGIKGVFYVFPVTDIVSVICCAGLLVYHRRKLQVPLKT